MLGYIPTGWFPAKLKVSNNGEKLIVSNAKGFGSGPNGGSTFNPGDEGSYIGSLMKGTVQILDIPTEEVLDSFQKKYSLRRCRGFASRGVDVCG